MIVLFRAIRSLWRAHQRKIDMEILWPLCYKGANDLDHAKAAFAVHCFNDPAWRELGEVKLYSFIDNLMDPRVVHASSRSMNLCEPVTVPQVADRQTIYSESNDPRLEPGYVPPTKHPRAQSLRSPPRKQGPSGLHRPQD